MKLELRIWDTNSIAEKQDILLYCERAILKTWREEFDVLPPIRVKHEKNAITVTLPAEASNEYFLRRFNLRLIRLHYWNRSDEPLVWTNEWM